MRSRSRGWFRIRKVLSTLNDFGTPKESEGLDLITVKLITAIRSNDPTVKKKKYTVMQRTKCAKSKEWHNKDRRI